MARTLQPLKLILLGTLTIFLFSGCAAGPQGFSSGGAAQGDPTQLAPQSILLQKALAAIDEQDDATAVKQFDKVLKADEEVPEEYLLDYGLALSRTGRYEDAIEQLTLYLNDLPARGLDSPQARTERALAEQQLAATARVDLTRKSIRKIGRSIDRNWQTVQQQIEAGVTPLTEPLTGMQMVLIKGDCYQMGNQFGDGETKERPVHEVCIDDYYLGRYEVTQQQWLQVMGYNHSENRQGGDHPVDKVSWQEAMAFAAALSGPQGHYRLPTEAEWEYAARSGGLKQKFSGGDQVDALAWHQDNSGGSSHPVGQKQANGLGLYDMSGNLYEWCLDRYASDYYQRSPQQNPTGGTERADRVLRGGSWDSSIFYSRTSDRSERDKPNYRHKKVGFRLALPLSAGKRPDE